MLRVRRKRTTQRECAAIESRFRAIQPLDESHFSSQYSCESVTTIFLQIHHRLIRLAPLRIRHHALHIHDRQCPQFTLNESHANSDSSCEHEKASAKLPGGLPAGDRSVFVLFTPGVRFLPSVQGTYG
jgi:hypothetical protein